MRKLYLLVLLVCGTNFLTSAQQVAIISGKLTNGAHNDVTIVAYNNHITYEIDTLTLGKTSQTGEFSVTLMLKKPRFVKFLVAEDALDLYLYPGAELELYGELFNTEKPVQFSGPAATINRYIQLAAKRINKNYEQKTAAQRQDVKKFTSFSDSMLKSDLQFLSLYFDTATGLTGADTKFEDEMRQTLIYTWANDHFNYPGNYRYYHKAMQNPVMPEGYYGFLDTMKIDNPEMAHVTAYVDFINNYTNYQLEKSKVKVRGGSASPSDYKLNIIEKTFTEDARDVASAVIISDYIKQEDDLEKASEMVLKFKETSDPETYKIVQEQLNIRFALKPANPAPSFTLKDLNGNSVNLSDFKGKVVYLDFWASWCGPCIAQVPDAKKLHKAFKDSAVVFLNVSLDTDEAAWRKSIQKHGIEGVNLIYSGNRSAGVIKDYGITGIPHYVLIDKQGNIIENKTERPGNARELIFQALQTH